jgi:tetratricopeptide (TPR) repeat protein
MRSAALFLAFAAALPGRALAEPELLKEARRAMDYGKFEDALAKVDELQQQGVLADEAEIVEAWRIKALSHFYLGNLPEARKAFIEILLVNPDLTFDPMLVAPRAIEEMDKLRQEKKAELDPIRAKRKALEDLKRLQEDSRRKLLESEGRRPRGEAACYERPVRRTSFLTVFLPFGAAQIEQDRVGAGTAVAIAESVAIVGTIVSYSQGKNRVGSDGHVDDAAAKAAFQTWRTVNWVSFGAMAGVYLTGVVDAAVHHRLEVAGDAVLKPCDKILPPPAKPSGPKASLFLAPAPGGASGGFALSF